MSTLLWKNFLLSIVADESTSKLSKQIQAVRLLSSTLPFWPVVECYMTPFLEKVFRLLGRIGLMCEASNELHSNKCRVSLTASHNSSLAEELVSLVRYLHSLPSWNNLLNDFLGTKLALASDLLRGRPFFHVQQNENGGEYSLASQQSAMAILSVMGGLDKRPRIGGLIEVDKKRATVCNLTKTQLSVQFQKSGERKKVSFNSFKSVNDTFNLDKMPLTGQLKCIWANLLLGHCGMDKRPGGMPVIAGTVNASILRMQQQQLAAFNAGKTLIKYQSKLRKVLLCPITNSDGDRDTLLRALLIRATKPQPLKPIFKMEELETAALIVSQYLASELRHTPIHCSGKRR